jgi:hypothetical protein
VPTGQSAFLVRPKPAELTLAGAVSAAIAARQAIDAMRIVAEFLARRRLKLVVLAAILASCSELPPTVIPPPPDTTPIERILGVADIARLTDAATAPHKAPIRVLFIHGMGTGESDYCTPAGLIGAVSGAVAAGPQVTPPLTLAKCGALTVPWPSVISIRGTPLKALLFTYAFKGDGISTRDMYFSFLLWAPLTAPFKNTLNEPGHPDWAWVTTQSKSFFQTHLSDVVLYGGTYRKVMRTAVEKAMCMFVNGEPSDDGHTCDHAERGIATVVITHSLGSYMFADAVADLRVANAQLDHQFPPQPHEFDSYVGSAHDAGAVILEQTELVYMLANQLAILDLTTAMQPPTGPSTLGSLQCRQLPVHGTVEEAESSGVSKSLIDQWRCGHEMAPQAHKTPDQQIVAFSDPDDLLSYMVSRNDVQASAGSDNTHVANIYLGVTPTILGLLANPVDAHLNYLTNSTVMKIIACGMTGNDVNPYPC